MLDLNRLENVRTTAGKTVARCPACAEGGADRAGDHLVILTNGRFGCVNHPGREGQEHRKRVFELVGIKAEQAPPRRPGRTPRPQSIPKPPAPLTPLKIDLRDPTANDLSAIAHLRGWPVWAGLQIAAHRGLLGMADLNDAGTVTPAWTLTDSSRHAAQARRLDGQAWRGIGAKAKTLPGSSASWPVGAAAIGDRPVVLLCEGGPDMLAAITVAWILGVAADVAPVAMLGAGQTIHADALPHLRGRHLRIVEQNDDAARKAGRRWAEQLRPIAATITGWEPPAEDKDVADTLARLAALDDDLERLADDLLATEILTGLGLTPKGGWHD
jgi:hypothetical protein